MSGWDEGNQRMEGMPIRAQEPGNADPEILTARFANFLKNFTENAQNFFLYREQLVSQNEVQLEGTAFIRVLLDHLIMFDRDLSERLIATPAKTLHAFEAAAMNVYYELTQRRPGDGEYYRFQVQFYSKAGADGVRNNLRTLGSADVTKLVVLDGIIIRAAPPRAKASSIIVRCRKCQEQLSRITVRPGVSGFSYPRYCRNANCDKPQDSLYIVPELSEYVDQQQLRLQELPESVPPSEMPRHVSMTVDRALVNSIAAGMRVRIVGIYSIFTQQSRGSSDKLGNGAIAVKQTYIRVIGLQALPSPASGRTISSEFSPEEEAQFRELSMAPDIYERISRSIAPSIFGLEDQKKAVACLLFGGARKKLPDGMNLRGDINVLFLGDPATAKSQLLKFAERVAPICIYTSGKGSSAAGLTASVVRDTGSGEWQLEAGAMVLADGGVVCIDEFDKMREEDRVAIHEAMEQQTISIAKAGITTILNSRTSVLAAANPSFGRYDDMKTAAEQIDFQTTILSRFDLIFVVKDSRVEVKDKRMAKHIMNLHMGIETAEQVGDIDVPVLKRYIEFCRTRVSPRLTVDACESLRNQFVSIRNEHRLKIREGSVIPITIRQLEAIVRLSESIARMSCTPDVTDVHVAEAFRLFRVSTLDAASTGLEIDGSAANDPNFVTKVTEAEKWIRGRMAVGSSIPERVLMEASNRQGMQTSHVRKALQVMLNRGQLVVRAQGNLLTRAR